MLPHQLTETLSRATGHSPEEIFDHFSNHAEASAIVFTIVFAVVSVLLVLAFGLLSRHTDIERDGAPAPLLAGWMLFYISLVGWLAVAFLVIPGTLATSLDPNVKAYEKLLHFSNEYDCRYELPVDSVDTEVLIQEIEEEIDQANAMIEEYEKDVIPPNPEVEKILNGEYH